MLHHGWGMPLPGLYGRPWDSNYWKFLYWLPLTSLKPLQIIEDQAPLDDTWLILGLRPAIGRRRYEVTTCLVGWTQTKIQPCDTYQNNLVSVITKDEW